MRHHYGWQILLAFCLIFFLLGTGTLVYHWAEGWSYTDSFYFTGITLTTIGYGDLTPTTPGTRIATVFFGFFGIGLVFYTATLLARLAFRMEEQQIDRILRRRVQRRLAEERETDEKVHRAEQKALKVEEKAEQEVVKLAEKLAKKK